MIRKRYLGPAIAGVAVFGAVTAFAAGFSVNSTSVAAGGTSVTGCNATAAATYDTVWDAALHAYKVSTAPVTTAASCHDMAYKVTLTDASDASLGEVTGTLDATTGNASPDFSSQNILVSNVAGVSVTVTG